MNKKQTDANLEILKEFEDISGLFVNIFKTQICMFDPLIDTSDYEERKMDKADMNDKGLEITSIFKTVGIKFTQCFKKVNQNYIQYLSNI